MTLGSETVLSDHFVGQSCALLTAISWAYALVLFKLSGERIPPIALNLYKNAVGLVLLVVTLAVLIAAGRDSFALLTEHPADICLLLLSGMIGIAIADSMLFFSLNLIGVGLMAVIDCTYTPIIILFSWGLLDEKLTVFHYIGTGLIVAGVFVVTRHKPPADRTRAQLCVGMLLGVGAIATMAIGIVMVKPILETFPLIWATTIRLAAGFGFLALFALLGRNWRAHWAVFRPTRTWKHALPASILGTYICLILWIAGFKYTYASVAAALNQTSVVFAGLFAALILREHFGGRKLTALILAVVGVFVVTMNEGLGRAWDWIVARWYVI